MANFPYPNESVSSIIGLIEYNNEITGGLFAMVSLLGFFIIGVLALKEFETGQAIVGSAFLTMVLGFFLFLMGVIDSKLLWLPVAFLAGGTVWLIFQKNR